MRQDHPRTNALRLIEPDSGEVIFIGENLLTLGRKALRAARRQMQMVFQDSFSSLGPRMRVGEIVAEPLRIHEPRLSTAERTERTGAILDRVGLSKDALRRYPHEFSGGQRQRIGIARALIRSRVHAGIARRRPPTAASLIGLTRFSRSLFRLSCAFLFRYNSR